MISKIDEAILAAGERAGHWRKATDSIKGDPAANSPNYPGKMAFLHGIYEEMEFMAKKENWDRPNRRESLVKYSAHSIRLIDITSRQFVLSDDVAKAVAAMRTMALEILIDQG